MVCGPKCTGVIMIVSLWGVCFMLILGGSFFNESVGLVDDLPEFDSTNMTWEQEKSKIKELYRQNAFNSWAAAAIHAGVFIIATIRMSCLIGLKCK